MSTADANMHWVETFYRRQHAWSAAYRGPINEAHRTRAAQIGAACGKARARVLERGGGGGKMAAATADAGHLVTVVELVDTLVAEIAARAVDRPNRQPVHGDFYTLPLAGPFDVVSYWDGFGCGSDEDQQRLLRRIAAWLAADGCALIDVFTPWYWAAVSGQEMALAGTRRRYGFDAAGCRLTDTWWPAGNEKEAVTQSLRCYSPADLRLLLRGTGLQLDALEPGGAMLNNSYVPRVPLARAMSYCATLRPTA